MPRGERSYLDVSDWGPGDFLRSSIAAIHDHRFLYYDEPKALLISQEQNDAVKATTHGVIAPGPVTNLWGIPVEVLTDEYGYYVGGPMHGDKLPSHRPTSGPPIQVAMLTNREDLIAREESYEPRKLQGPGAWLRYWGWTGMTVEASTELFWTELRRMVAAA